MPLGLLPRILSYSDPPLECLRLSMVKNLYHSTVNGIVVKCHRACASIASYQGGKSNTSKAPANSIKTEKHSDSLASGRRKWIMDQTSQMAMNVADRPMDTFIFQL